MSLDTGLLSFLIESKTETDMKTPQTMLLEEMQQRARTCENVARDKFQEALTGASSEKDGNTRDAKEWMIRLKVWLEAEAIVAGVFFQQNVTNDGLAHLNGARR